ncbi:hypothetical protein [Ruminococcus albus]|uniref:Uncharacterized protein n=1 Tax=Ruminococcus albus TaxID=1264 RepID=A0A1I1Q1G2_RUMAL|nr:hypothetical protein [Ruminococcus albus]SFD13698.1 hypothetical protein SAMN02910406_03193 [Ruminococcus albus]
MNDITENNDQKQNSPKKSWKKLIAAAIIAVIGFSAYGGYKAYKRYKFNKQWQLQNQIAEENALEYVRDKYAIDDAEVVSFSNDDLDDLRRFKDGEESWINRDHNVVTLDSDGHEFRVVVKWRERSSEGYDSYYTDEIEELLEQQIVESCNGEPVYANISVGTFNKDQVWSYRGVYMAKDEHFDGSDLKGVLKDKILSVEAVVIDTVFDDHELFDMLAEIDADADFYSFDTMEHFEASKELKAELNGNDLGKMKYAPYITDYRTIHDGKNVHRDFGVKTKDDMLFRAFPDTHSDPDAYTCDKVEIQDSDNIDEYYSYNKLDEYLRSPISSGYFLSRDNGFCTIICIYYPLEKLKGHDIEDVGLAWAESTKRYAIMRPDIVGDYAVFILNTDISFKLVDTKGLEPLEPKYSY